MNLDILEQEKFPTTKDKYVGIEIEFFTPTPKRDKIESDLVKAGLAYNCHLGEDGSIEYKIEKKLTKIQEEKLKIFKLEIMELRKKRLEIVNKYPSTYYYNNKEYEKLGTRLYNLEDKVYDLEQGEELYDAEDFELRILCKESEMKDIIYKALEIINKHGGHVNSSCGLHVHLDMRNRDWKKCAERLFNHQDEMKEMVKKERLNSVYCKLNDKNSLTKPNGRRMAINTTAVKEHNTIEVRLHHGSLDAKEIYLWCKYLIYRVEDKPLTLELNHYIQAKKRKYVEAKTA